MGSCITMSCMRSFIEQVRLESVLKLGELKCFTKEQKILFLGWFSKSRKNLILSTFEMTLSAKYCWRQPRNKSVKGFLLWKALRVDKKKVSLGKQLRSPCPLKWFYICFFFARAEFKVKNISRILMVFYTIKTILSRPFYLE